ncbi:interleukin-6 [Alligator mississippiensis]|uniref:Interleukin-6 n=1 Tax=Alligator mississippiensis TaxID=8496 RepID=A0A151MQI6_ALLMI|nr:interleukin-6 [Alligator mississippiensis]
MPRSAAWAAAAVALLLGAAALPVPDSSGEEDLVDETSPSRSSPVPDYESLAWLLRSRAARLKHEEKCLIKISSGLFAFQPYLEYIHVQETFISEKQKIETIWYGTKHLANTVRQMMENPDAVPIPDQTSQKTLLEKLKANKNWREKIATHFILRDFTSFMEKTVRALRYIRKTRSSSA